MDARHPKWIVAGILALAVTSAFAGEITLYERPDFQGRYAIANDEMAIMANSGFLDTASSVVVRDGTWEVCTVAYFRGRCAELVPGNYPGIDVTLNARIASARQVGYADRPPRIALGPTVIDPPPRVMIVPSPVSAVPPPTGRAILYEEPNFGGAWAAVDRGVANDLEWAHFTNPAHRAASIRVESGTWQFCTDLAFQGQCRVLGPGEYPYPPGGLMEGISSARQVWNPVYGSLDLYRR
jgi:hypothetical protein